MTPEVERILSRTDQPLPLDQKYLHPSADVCGLRSAEALFPAARFPQAALAGLLLRAGCWKASHEVAQEIESPEGSYWHGIAHRIEPDSFNAGYWFRLVGQHAIFPELHARAEAILAQHPGLNWRLKNVWDPFLFIEWCDKARQTHGDAKRAAVEIQSSEWDLLFAWCAGERL